MKTLLKAVVSFWILCAVVFGQSQLINNGQFSGNNNNLLSGGVLNVNSGASELINSGGTLAVQSGGVLQIKAASSGQMLYVSDSSGTVSPLSLGSGITITGGTLNVASSTGTVTSVGMTVPAFLSVSGSPITGSGTLAVSLANATTNYVFAGPGSGSPAAPTFRALVAADLPVINLASSAAGGVSGNLAVTNLNSGTSASSSTYWCGNGTWATPSGGGGSPGGSNTQVQFNNSGSFGGSSSFTWNGSELALAGSGTIFNATVTTSSTINAFTVTTSGGGQACLATINNGGAYMFFGTGNSGSGFGFANQGQIAAGNGFIFDTDNGGASGGTDPIIMRIGGYNGNTVATFTSTGMTIGSGYDLTLGRAYVSSTYTTGTGSIDLKDSAGTVYHVIVHN